MSSVSPLRRMFVLALAAAVAASALALAPFSIATAQAATSLSTKSILDGVDAWRAPITNTHYIRNAYINDFAKAYAKAHAACGVPCKHYKEPLVNLPGDPVEFYNFEARITGTGSRSARIVKQFLAEDGGGVLTDPAAAYAGAAFVTKGDTTWATMTIARYDVAPLDRMTAPKLTVSGTTRVGSILKATFGSFSPAATTVTINWRIGKFVVGHDPSYTVTADDLGKKVSVSVIGERDGFDGAARTVDFAKKVAKGVFHPGTPTLSGNRNVGSTLTAQVGSWKPVPAGYVYQWLRDGKVIPGQFQSTYTQVAADKGKRITVTVGGNTLGFVPASRTSTTTIKTGAPLLGWINAPVVSGTPQVNETLTANIVAWGPGTVTYSYAWKVGGTMVPATNSKYYFVAPKDVGKKITVTVTGRESGFTTQSLTSVATDKVLPIQFSQVPAPIVSGTLTVGSTLSVSTGSWLPTPTKVTYRWFRNFVPIAGATHRTYKVTAADVGQMSVGIIGSKTGYSSTAVYTSFFIAPK